MVNEETSFRLSSTQRIQQNLIDQTFCWTENEGQWRAPTSTHEA